MTAGYSGTPLAKKLSLKSGMRVWFDAMPESVRAEIVDAALTLHECSLPEALLDAAHIFVTERPLLAPAGFLWISWPKKASKVPTDITEDIIRAVILPNTDLVDVKVCAVDTTWSGLKLMIHKDKR